MSYSDAPMDVRKVIEHLEAKWHGQVCPMCTHSNWEVQDSVFELREFKGGNLVVGGAGIVPVVPVTCTNCGNTVLVNSIVAGVTPKKEGV